MLKYEASLKEFNSQCEIKKDKMGKRYTEINETQASFIKNQKIFFVGTAATDGRVNISPKGMDSFRVIGANKIVWLNLTGSGNETAAHLQLNDRMTIMFCAFDGKPLILRLYGNATIYHPRNEEFDQLNTLFSEIPGKRQIIEMSVDLVQESCGFAVPLLDFKEERVILKNWADKQGKNGISEYWAAKNTKSIDNFDTKIFG